MKDPEKRTYNPVSVTIRDMLTIIDGNSDKIPEGVYLQMMNQCKELYDV